MAQDDGDPNREAAQLLERTADACREAQRLREIARGTSRDREVSTAQAQEQLRGQAAAAQAPLANLEAGMDRAQTTEALQAWSVAQPWRDHLRSASDVAEQAERRLSTLQPDLMRQYQQNLADQNQRGPIDNSVRADAMVDASRDVVLRQEEVVVAGRPADVGAAAADRSAAMQERQAAQEDFGQPDLASTPNVDERSVGAAHGADHQELSDARAAQAESRVGRAYPETIHTALTARSSASSAPAKAPARQAAQTAAQAPARRGR